MEKEKKACSLCGGTFNESEMNENVCWDCYDAFQNEDEYDARSQRRVRMKKNAEDKS